MPRQPFGGLCSFGGVDKTYMCLTNIGLTCTGGICVCDSVVILCDLFLKNYQ